MLSETQVRALIAHRIYRVAASCNSYHINHVEGQIRALVAVLDGGKAPPATGDARDYLRAAGIPFADAEPGRFSIPDDWLLAHGFVLRDGHVSHPDFTDW